MLTLSARIVHDRYQLLEVLGEGGMSTVYLAADRTLPNKTWAVKEVYPDPVNEDDARAAMEAFESEARVLGTLRHQGVPVIVDAFVEAGKGYLVMERVAGRDLQSVLDEGGRLSEDDALQLGLDICAILRYLHERAEPLIFRDLKPSNVMVVAGQERDRIVLIDFGIARHFKSQRRKDTIVIGTLGYAAPEQYTATAAADPRSDIYSLGALMYFALTGRDPQLHAPFDFPPLSEFIPNVSAQTASAIHQALQYDAANRPATVQALEAMLEHARTTLRERRDRPALKHRPRNALLALLVLVAIIAALFSHRPTPPPPQVAVPSTDATFAVPMVWRNITPSTLPPPMGRPLLLFGPDVAYAVMTRPGPTAGVGSYGDTIALTPDLSTVRSAPNLQYYGRPSCVVDEKGRLLISDVRGVTRVEGTSHRLLWKPDGRRGSSAVRLFKGGDGLPYAVYAGGFARIEEDGPTTFRHLVRTAVGYNVVSGAWQTSPPDTWLPRDSRRFHVDAQGAMWLDDRGLVRVRPDGVATRFGHIELAADGADVHFASDARGTWIGVRGEDGLRLQHAQTPTAIVIQRSGSLRQIVLGADGLYVVTDKRLYRVVDGSPSIVTVPWDNKDSAQYAAAFDGRSRLYFWGPQGLYRLENQQWARGEFKKPPKGMHWTPPQK